MKDSYGRDITYLRLSVTDLCNLRCVYCMPDSGVEKRRHNEIITVEEIEAIVRAAAKCGIRKVRLTGGEPLVRRGIVEICRRVAAIDGIDELCITTNGILLPRYAQELHQAGVSRINLSLDTMDPEKYKKITRLGSLDDALAGLNSALEAGFSPIKINAVLMGGVNDDEIPAFVELTRERDVHIRFIELMPIGECASWDKERFIPASAILKAEPRLIPVDTDGVAWRYRVPGYVGTVGLIAPISSHFCPSCNRIRVTADGKLKACLHSSPETNLRGLSEAELEKAMRDAIYGKPQRHHLEAGVPSETGRNMNEIGG